MAVILLIALAVLAWWADKRLVNEARSEISRELNAVLSTTTRALDQWFQNFEEVLHIWGSDVATLELSQALLGLGRDYETLRSTPVQMQISEHLRPVMALPGMRGYSIYSTDGFVLSSSRLADLGRQASSPELQDLLNRTLQSVSRALISLPLKGQGRDYATMVGAFAVRDESGDPVVILTLRIDPESQFTEILQRGRMGVSGESYAFNSGGKMISESRFGEDLKALALVPDMGVSILTVDIRDPGGNLLEGHRPAVQREKQPLTLMAQSAINGNSDENLEGYNDYRGVPVIGAWSWNADHGFGITTEIDVDEAYQALSATRKLFYFLVGFSALLVLALTVYFVRSRQKISETLLELKKSTEQTTLILENATDGILTIDDAQRIVRFNPACEEIWGYTAAEVIGENLTILLPRHVRKEHLSHLHKFRDAKRSGISIKDRGRELAGVRKDGSEFPAEVGFSMAEIDGEVQYTAFIKDITERKQAESEILAAKAFAEQAEARSRLFLESVRDGIYGVDLEGRLSFMNPAVTDLLGYAEDELMGECIHPIIHHSRADGSPYPVEECPMRAAFTDGQYSLVDDEVLWHKDGRAIDVEYSAVPMENDGKLVGSVVVFRDIRERKENERKIRESELEFRTMVATIPGTVYRALPDGHRTMLFISPEVDRLTGYPADEFLDNSIRSFASVINPIDLEYVVESIRGAVGRREPYYLEYRIEDVEGEVRYVFERGQAVYDQKGQAENLIGTIIDITDRKKMERDLAKAKRRADVALNELEGVSSVILRWTPDARISSINDYGCELFGYTQNELVGKSLFETIVKDVDTARVGVKGMVDNIVKDPEAYAHVEGLNRTKDGTGVWMSWSNNPILGNKGKLNEVLAIGVDITDRKKLEKQLQGAKEVAEAATLAKGDFLANMSHEIRTPMNAVIGLSDLCLRTNLTAKQHDYLNKIHGSAISLLGIINDILDFSKIEAGKLDVEHIDFEIDDVLENLATVANVKTQEKGLELLFRRDPGIPTILVGDPLRLGQILINLTNNAVKFTEKGEILVDIVLLEQNNEQVTLKISVRDTGIGMTEKQQSKLFQSFSQVDTSTTRKYGGTGLGLAISKQLVELMGGEIGVDSEAGIGSTFHFTVKLGVGEGADEKKFSTIPKLQHLHALVADDNPTAREILSSYLESFTFEVDTAANADGVFELIEKAEKAYDLMVIDQLMPGMKGLDVAHKIKTELRLETDPHIILVSAFSSGDVLDKPGGEYIDKFLAKPVSPSHLFDAVMGAFGVKSHSARRKHNLREIDLASLRPIQGANILLVEDNEINQQVASEILKQAGFFVEIANHGQEALDMLDQGAYDCLLMDVQMPVMDGYTATGKIREQQRFSDLPVLAMTANATIEDREKSLAAGMNEHIAKPINPKILFEALLEWITHKNRELPPSFETVERGGDHHELPDLPGIDVADGVSRMGGNLQSYVRLLRKFAENQSSAVDEITAAVKSSNQPEAERFAHTLKGVSGNIGATQLRELAANIEVAIKSGVSDQLHDLIQKTNVELKRVVSIIRGLDEGVDPEANVGGLPDDLLQQLERLLDKLEDYDSSAEDDLLNILDLVRGTPVHDMLTGIKNKITQYDFEGAAEDLKPLMEEINSTGGAGD